MFYSLLNDKHIMQKRSKRANKVWTTLAYKTSERLSRFVPQDRCLFVGRCFWKLQKHLLETVLAGPRTLLDIAVLGSAPKKDRTEAWTADRCGHASIHRNCKEDGDAHGRANPCQKEKSKARIFSRGGSGVSGGASQSPQWISTRPGKKKIEKERISDYQKILAGELGLKPNETKLVLTLQDKKNYVVHYRNLQFYLKLGMKLKQVHSTLEFDQECWMKHYIRMNTKLRKKATNELEKNFYKLMKNSVFGKTMENVRKRVDIKIVCSDEKKKSQTDYESVYCGVHAFLQQLRRLACSMHRENVRLDKPLYAGMTILDNSKILMYDLFLQHAHKAVQREVWTRLHRRRQPLAGDTKQRCLQGLGRQKVFVRHKRLPQWSPAL